MHCIDKRWLGCVVALGLLLGLGGCGSSVRGGGAVGAGSAAGTAGPDATATPRPSSPPPATTARPLPSAGPAPSAATRPSAALPPPIGRARNWADYQKNAARRMVAANQAGSYVGTPPEPLLAIPVLEVELNADGSVRQVNVLRQPSQARDTVQLAVSAVHRAAPFGEVAHLPRPWRFSEAFLFDDQRRFKPRSLD